MREPRLTRGVDTALVMKILEPIWKTKPETAGRVRGRIESVLDWAVRGYRQGENPARWRGHIKTCCRRYRRSIVLHMKMGREHLVPLTDASMAILEKLRHGRGGDFI